jgi:hypothetical protein
MRPTAAATATIDANGFQRRVQRHFYGGGGDGTLHVRRRHMFHQFGYFDFKGAILLRTRAFLGQQFQYFFLHLIETLL